MDLLEDLRMQVLNFSLVMINDLLVLLKNHFNYLKDNMFECFFKKYEKFYFLKN